MIYRENVNSISEDEKLSDESATFTKPEKVTPRDLLGFAKAILCGLAILFLIGSVCELISPKNAVFEACKTILPSIATLVIGYYFGASSK